MNRRPLRVISLCIALNALCLGQTAPSYSRFEGLPIKEVTVPHWAESLEIPIKSGKMLHVKDIEDTEVILRQYLDTIAPNYPFPVTLAVGLFATTVKRKKHGMVKVNFRVRRLVLTNDDTPGRAIDEASNWNPAYHAFETIGGIQADNRFVAGELGFATPSIPAPLGLSLRPIVDMWVQPRINTHQIKTTITLPPPINKTITVPLFNLPIFSSGFYALKGRLPITTRLSRLVCEPQTNLSDLPFADGELMNFSIGAGCNYRFRTESLSGWRATARYRFSKQKMIVLNVPDRYYLDNGMQAELSKEYSIPEGFLRVAPWMDLDSSHVAPLSLRFGGNLRFYREWTPGRGQSILTDISSSAATSVGPLSTNRSFTGGSTFDPPLLEQPLGIEDYTWIGPILRGYGFSEFRAPTPQTLLTREGTSFAGVSVTIGLPGWSNLLFDNKTPEYRQQLIELANNLTSMSRAQAFEDYLKTESDPEKARAFAQKRVNTTKAMLHNLFQHAKQFSIRPLLIYDYGSIMSRDAATVRDWSAGAGFRVWFRLGILEAVYAQNGGAIPGGSQHNLEVRFRLRGSGSARQPYPF